MDDHAAAGAGADDHAEHRRRARRRAVGGLRQREAVGVVRDPHRPAERGAESVLKRRPLSHVEFAFLTSPVAGEMAPGMPTPTVHRLDTSRSSRVTSPATAATVSS